MVEVVAAVEVAAQEVATLLHQEVAIAVIAVPVAAMPAVQEAILQAQAVIHTVLRQADLTHR